MSAALFLRYLHYGKQSRVTIIFSKKKKKREEKMLKTVSSSFMECHKLYLIIIH